MTMKLVFLFYIESAKSVCVAAFVKCLEEGRHACYIVAQIYTPRSHVKICFVADFGQEVAHDSLEISLQRSRAFESASAQRSGFMGCHLKLEK